jgi:hypothetical protein
MNHAGALYGLGAEARPTSVRGNGGPEDSVSECCRSMGSMNRAGTRWLDIQSIVCPIRRLNSKSW